MPGHACPICGAVLERAPVERKARHALLQCAICELQVWSPAAAADAAWYEGSTHYLASPLVDWLAWYHGWSLEHLPSDVHRLLDIGCADGRFVYAAARRGVDARGIDHSPRLVALGNQRHGGERLTRMSIAELSEARERFDAVTMFELIEHVEDPLALLRLSRSLLRPNGVVAVSTPNRLGRPWPHQLDSPPHHLTRWTPRALRTALERAEFEVVELELSPPEVGLYTFLLDVRLGLLVRVLRQRALRGELRPHANADARAVLALKDRLARVGATLLAPFAGRWFRGAQMVAVARMVS